MSQNCEDRSMNVFKSLCMHGLEIYTSVASILKVLDPHLLSGRYRRKNTRHENVAKGVRLAPRARTVQEDLQSPYFFKEDVKNSLIFAQKEIQCLGGSG